jgi:hypothetical protein
MIWVIHQLAAPVRYLSIAQGGGLFTSKATYDFVLPTAISLIATFVVWRFSFSLGLYAADGFIPGIINLLNLLIAFFIAALAAVATFDRPGLDDPMKGEPATMKRRDSKNIVRDRFLTHRQFICYLFGYLSFSTIMLLLILYGFRLVGHEAAASLDLHVHVWGPVFALKPLLKLIGTFVFFFLFTQIIVTMLLGIYFLSDRFQFLDDPND